MDSILSVLFHNLFPFLNLWHYVKTTQCDRRGEEQMPFEAVKGTLCCAGQHQSKKWWLFFSGCALRLLPEALIGDDPLRGMLAKSEACAVLRGAPFHPAHTK